MRSILSLVPVLCSSVRLGGSNRVEAGVEPLSPVENTQVIENTRRRSRKKRGSAVRMYTACTRSSQKK